MGNKHCYTTCIFKGNWNLVEKKGKKNSGKR